MKKPQSHANCAHAATKVERAKCRRQRNSVAASNREAVVEIVANYYGGADDVETIMAQLLAIDPALTEGYYNGTLDVEEIIANARYYGA